MIPYKFVSWATSEQPPQTATTMLLEKLDSNKKLTRAEKDRVAEILYGLFSCNGSTYKLNGWAWSVRSAKQIRRILVSFKEDSNTFHAFFAPDKVSLRKAIHSCGQKVREMIYADRKLRVKA